MSLRRHAGFFTLLFSCLTLGWSAFHSPVHAALIVSLVEESVAASYSNPFLVQGGFGEDAIAFSDRLHQWNSVSLSNSVGQPTIAGLGLEGADYVRLANDARAVSATSAAYSLTFAEEARVFIFVDTRHTEPAWMAQMGFERIASNNPDGYYRLGYDEAQTSTELGIGAGVSVNMQGWIYTAKLSAGTHQFNGLGFSGNNNYGIVATSAKTVVGGVRRLNGNSATPILQRQGVSNLAKAYVDRTHRLVLQSTVLDAFPSLNGADLLQLSNDVRDTAASTPLYEVTLLEDSYAYLLLDDRYSKSGSESLNWIASLGFTDTLVNAGMDENGDGNSDQTLSIYRALFTQGTHQFYGMEFSNSNHYILAFHAVPEPGKIFFLLMGSSLLCFIRRRSTT